MIICSSVAISGTLTYISLKKKLRTYVKNIHNKKTYQKIKKNQVTNYRKKITRCTHSGCKVRRP